MYQRIIAVVAGALFALIAVVGAVMTDLHDRSYPEQLGAESSLYLDYTSSGLSDSAALAELGRMSDRWGLGLVRILPDLAGDTDGQIFATVGTPPKDRPVRIQWYGDQPAGAVRGPDALRYSFATGQYLVTGSRGELDKLQEKLTADGVRVRRVDDTFAQSATFLFRQESFRTTLTAGLALMISMALFWLSVRSRGRALRVLGGVGARRIQAEDLGRLTIAVALPALPVTAVAVGVVALRHGSTWLRYYTTTLVGLELAVIAVTVLGALVISVLSWPSARMLATRQPAVRGLQRTAGVLKGVTFVLVLLTAGPAWWAYGDAQAAAAQEARWQSLSDQVALRFPAGLGEKGFVRVREQVGDVVAEADRSGSAALSYALPPSQLGVHSSAYDFVVLVNQTWLDLMGVDLDSASGAALRPVDAESVPHSLVAGLTPNLDLWARSPQTGQQVWQSLRMLTTGTGPGVPMAAGGNGDLVFPHHPLLLVVPSAVTFNDDFLASLTSTNNLVFGGLDATLSLLREQGLEQTIQVKYAAEDGVLRAQFAAYEAWLRGFALVALAAAFALALAISAFIAALIHARRDFPLRLDGRGWPAVLAPRVGQELLIGLVLGSIVMLLQPPGQVRPTLVALLAGLVGTSLAHLWTAGWSFRRIVHRTI